MGFDSSMTRRAFVTVAATLAASLLAGCSQNSPNADYTFERDDTLPILGGSDEGSAVCALDAWTMSDGWIQVQVAGGSIPPAEIERVSREEDTLTVEMSDRVGPTTMDIELAEFRIEGPDLDNVEVVQIRKASGVVEALRV